MDYPGITICSQGWIPEVVNQAALKQVEEFIANKHGIDVETVRENLKNESLKVQYEAEVYEELYPGSTSSVTNMVTSMSSNNPVGAKTSNIRLLHFLLSFNYEEFLLYG